MKDTARDKRIYVSNKDPIAWINFIYGWWEPDSNHLGLSPMFVAPGGVERLIEERLEPLYILGFRRFILWMPAGSFLQRLLSSSQWAPQPDWRKREWELLMIWIKERPDIEVSLGGGFRIRDPYSLAMPEGGSNPVRIPTPWLSDEDKHFYRETLLPWIELGVKGRYMTDHSSIVANRMHVAPLSRFLDSVYGIPVGGEAIPYISYNGLWHPSKHTQYNSWIALDRFFVRVDPGHLWRFDKNTEVFSIVFSTTYSPLKIIRRLNQGIGMAWGSLANDKAKNLLEWSREYNAKVNL